MLEKLRSRSREESGFTLVELLVVMLILGILAAIAIPAFFSQRDKAKDADAKSTVRTMQTSMESCATGNGGSYAAAGCPVSALTTIEPTLTGKTIAITSQASNAYEIKATSTTGNTFSIARATTGALTYPCTAAKAGAGCPSGLFWNP
jgi:type IV pilus assembly protein PilA